MSTPERIDLSKFPHGGMYDELRRAYAEIGRLEKECENGRVQLATCKEYYNAALSDLQRLIEERDRLRARALC